MQGWSDWRGHVLKQIKHPKCLCSVVYGAYFTAYKCNFAMTHLHAALREL